MKRKRQDVHEGSFKTLDVPHRRDIDTQSASSIPSSEPHVGSLQHDHRARRPTNDHRCSNVPNRPPHPFEPDPRPVRLQKALHLSMMVLLRHPPRPARDDEQPGRRLPERTRLSDRRVQRRRRVCVRELDARESLTKRGVLGGGGGGGQDVSVRRGRWGSVFRPGDVVCCLGLEVHLRRLSSVDRIREPDRLREG